MALDAKTSAPPAILEPVIASSNRAADIEPYSSSIYNEDPVKWSAILPTQFPQAADRQAEETFLRQWFDEREIHMQGGAHGPGNAFRFLKQVWYTIAMWNLYERIPRITRWWLSKKSNREVFDDKKMLSHICKPDSQPEAFFDPADFEMFGRPILINTVKHIQDLAVEKHAEIKPVLKPVRPQLERLQIPKRPYINQSEVKTGSPVGVKAAMHQPQILLGENLLPQPVMMAVAGSPLISPHSMPQQPTPLLASGHPVPMHAGVVTPSQNARNMPSPYNIPRPEHAKQPSLYPMAHQGQPHYHNDGTWVPAQLGRIHDVHSATNMHVPWSHARSAKDAHAGNYVQHQQQQGTRQPTSDRQQTNTERGSSRGRGSLRGRGRGRDKGNRRYSTTHEFDQPDNSNAYNAKQGSYTNRGQGQQPPHIGHVFQPYRGAIPAFNNGPEPHGPLHMPSIPREEALQQTPTPSFMNASHQGILTRDNTNAFFPPTDQHINTYGVGRSYIHASRKDVTELIVFSSPAGTSTETIIRLFAQKGIHNIKTGATATKNGTGQYLFVNCKNNDDARRALELSGSVVDSRKLTIEVSRKYWDPVRDGHYGPKQFYPMSRMPSQQAQPYPPDRPDGTWTPMVLPHPMPPRFQAEMLPPPQPVLYEQAVQQSMIEGTSPVPVDEPDVIARVRNKKKREKRDKSEMHGEGQQVEPFGSLQRRASVQQEEAEEVKHDESQRARKWSINGERRMSATHQQSSSSQQLHENNHLQPIIDASPKTKKSSRRSSEVSNPYEAQEPISTEGAATGTKYLGGDVTEQTTTDAPSRSSAAQTRKSSVNSIATLAKSVVDSVQSTRVDATVELPQAVEKHEAGGGHVKGDEKDLPKVTTQESAKEETATDGIASGTNDAKSSTEPISAIIESSAFVNDDKPGKQSMDVLHGAEHTSDKTKPDNDTTTKSKKSMTRSVSVQENDKAERPKGPSQTESFSMFGRKAEKTKKNVKSKGSIKGRPKEKNDRVVSAPLNTQSSHGSEQAESQSKKSGKQRAHTVTAASPSSSSKNKSNAGDVKNRSTNLVTSMFLGFFDPNADDRQSPSDDPPQTAMGDAAIHKTGIAAAGGDSDHVTPSDIKDASIMEDSSIDDIQSVSSRTLSNRSDPDQPTPSSSAGKRASKRSLIGTHLVEAPMCRNSKKRQVRRRAEQQVITTLEVEEAPSSGASVCAYSEDSHGNKVEQVWPVGYLALILNQNQQKLGNSIGPEARDPSFIHMPMPIYRLEGAPKDSIVELTNWQASEDAPVTSILTLRMPETSPERAAEESRVEEVTE